MNDNTGTINFADIFKKSILDTFDLTRMSYSDIIVSLLLASLLGFGIFFIYRKYYRGVMYNQAYNISLVLMTELTAMIILTISSNIVLSLGMVGALSIVRYRTAVKDAMDLLFMFWAVAVGIACGAGLFLLALMGSLIVWLSLFLLKHFKITDKAYVLIVRYDPQFDSEVRMILAQNKHEVKSKSSGADGIELTVQLRLRGDNHQIVHLLTDIQGVQHAVLVQYTGDYAS